MDIVFALLGLLPFALLFLVYAPVLMLADPGRPLITQTRIGRDRSPFKFFQFRIYRQGTNIDACRASYWMRRTGLDAVPQIFNVLLGLMSLVGPRPFIPSYDEHLRAHIEGYDDRFAVRPGLTSWAEVAFPSRNYASKTVAYRAAALPYDLLYIANRTPKFYLLIVFRSLENLWKGHDHRPFMGKILASR